MKIKSTCRCWEAYFFHLTPKYFLDNERLTLEIQISVYPFFKTWPQISIVEMFALLEHGIPG